MPFAVDVNVGTGNVNATWIDWTDWEAANGTCSNSNYYTRRAAAQSHGKIWTPEDAQHLERLRQRPRPEQRRASTPRPVAGSPATMYPRAPGVGLPDRDDAAVAPTGPRSTPRSTR